MSPGPVAIVGVGLMGGSLGLALGAAREVVGVDPDPEALRVALAVGAVEPGRGLARGGRRRRRGGRAGGARCPRWRASPAGPSSRRPTGCLVTDLGSAKAGLLEALSPAERERFIGGHPVCGVERTGVAFARRDLYRGATWFLTPGAEARPSCSSASTAWSARSGRGPWPSTLARTTA